MNNNWFKTITKEDISTYSDISSKISDLLSDLSSEDISTIIKSIDSYWKEYAKHINWILTKIGINKSELFNEIIKWISPEKVKNILLTGEWVRKIQAVKEDVVSKIFRTIWWNGSYKIDSRQVTEMDSIYYDIIDELEDKTLKDRSTYISSLKKDIENMYKWNEWFVLNSSNSSFSAWYLWDFINRLSVLQKYIWSSKRMLDMALSDRLVSEEEKKNIKEYKKLISQKEIPNTRQKDVDIDISLLDDSVKEYKDLKDKIEIKTIEIEQLEIQLKDQNVKDREELEWKLTEAKYIYDSLKLRSKEKKSDVKNMKCFYETDMEGNKNYFSYNTLINYIDTFWLEVWLPKVDLSSLDKDIKAAFFPSMDRVLKKHMHVTIIEWLRDKQELLMNNLPDYKLSSEDESDNKAWFIAEKIIELEFRELAHRSGLNIKIIKPSVWEDMINKVDLFIELEDEKTWVTIQKELQITLKTDLDLKKQQIAKRNKLLQKQWDFTESELIDFTMKDLGKKLNFWKAYNRPIWRLSDTLDDIETTTIRSTFRRLVDDLESKKGSIQK